MSQVTAAVFALVTNDSGFQTTLSDDREADYAGADAESSNQKGRRITWSTVSGSAVIYELLPQSIMIPSSSEE